MLLGFNSFGQVVHFTCVETKGKKRATGGKASIFIPLIKKIGYENKIAEIRRKREKVIEEKII